MQSCAEDSRLLVIVEPPLSVVNAFLDRVRRFAADLAGSIPDWLPPHYWSAPLVDLGPDSEEGRVFAQDVLRIAFRECAEFPVQLSPLAVAPGTVAGEVLVVAHVMSRGEALAGLAASACTAATAIGLPARAEALVQVPVATIRGEEAIRAATSLLAVPGEAQPIGWNLGGVCLASAVRDESGPWKARRLRSLPLKRAAAPRREGAAPAVAACGEADAGEPPRQAAIAEETESS
jgi:hypothetical protein